MYLQGERYTPTGEEEVRLFAPMQDSRLVETAVDGELLHVLTRQSHQSGIGALVNGVVDSVTLPLLVQSLGVDTAKAPPGLQGQITAWLKHEGWERKRSSAPPRPWIYVRPKDWPPEKRSGGLDGEGDDGGLPAGAPMPPDSFDASLGYGDGADAPF